MFFSRRGFLRRFCFLVLTVFQLCSLSTELTAAAATEEPENLYALSACLMDAKSGRVLFEKSGREKMAMASTTKIMTLLIALEYGKLDDVVTISEYAATMPDVQLNVRPGEAYYLKDLLYSLMLESHNDVAVAIAEHIGGSVEGFASLMNGKAKALGAMHTNFVTPNGLDAEEHYTTAVDLAWIAACAIQNPVFIEITNTTSHSFSEINGKRQFTVNNKNAFLTMMDGAIGIKTGFTGKAGYCFVGAIEQEEKQLVSVVLACGWPNNKSYKWSDTKKLMNYGLHSFSTKTMAEDEILLPLITVTGGCQDSIGLDTDFHGLSMLLTEEEQLTYQYELPKELTAPIQKGEQVGSLQIRIDDYVAAEYKIHAAETVLCADFFFYLNQVWNTFGNLGHLFLQSIAQFE